MNYNRLYFLLLLFAFSLGTPGLAQKRCISQDWNFCRISDETSKAEIKNQGSDWSSQYNVQHMDMNGIANWLFRKIPWERNCGSWRTNNGNKLLFRIRHL